MMHGAYNFELICQFCLSTKGLELLIIFLARSLVLFALFCSHVPAFYSAVSLLRYTSLPGFGFSSLN